jgi:hypothetical protein
MAITVSLQTSLLLLFKTMRLLKRSCQWPYLREAWAGNLAMDSPILPFRSDNVAAI